jgi:protein-tyrosine phosphatase
MQVDVLPLGDNGYQIKWSQPGQYTVACEGAIPESIEQGADAAVVHLPASALAKPVFTLTDQHGGVIRASERRVVLEGSRNFRDIGGYIGDGGRQVRWGRLFRSGR